MVVASSGRRARTRGNSFSPFASPPRGIARIALVAAFVLALGLGLSSEAHAQTSSFNGTQATTFTLTTGVDSSPFTFGPNANIGPTAVGTDGVDADTITNWKIINQGQINGGQNGVSLATPGGSSLINSGTITGTSRSVIFAFDAPGSLTNQASGTLNGNVIGVSSLINSGLIQGSVGGAQSFAAVTIINQSGGTITADVVFNANALATDLGATLANAGTIGGSVTSQGFAIVNNQAGGSIAGGVQTNASIHLGTPSTVTNAGTISGFGIALETGGSVTNSGTIIGTTVDPQLVGPTGIHAIFNDLHVTNLAGGVITGGTDGILTTVNSGTVLNAGSITGLAANGINFAIGGDITNLAGGSITGATNGISDQNGGSTITNQAGATITGANNGIQITNNSNTTAATTVTNAGTIAGTSGAGISFNGNSITVNNTAGATISGTVGVDFTNNSNAAALTNAGTITGTGGTAINLNANNNTLILQTGSVINGAVNLLPFQTSLFLQGHGSANQDFAFLEFLDVQASGLWVLNGTSSSDATQIDSGTLVLGDASHPGVQFTQLGGNALIVNAGGTLAGQGTLIGNLVAAAGGTIAPGAATPFSTFHVTGDGQFNVGSFYNVNVNPAGQTDKLALSGNATLTGGTVQVQPAAGNYAAQTTYSILTAGNRNSTTFAGVTSNSIFLSPTLTYPSQQEVDLTLSSRAFNTAASTPNQTAVANALNAGAQNALTAVLFGQTSIAGAQQIFNSLSGDFYASIQNTQADQTLIAREAMLNRLRLGDAGAASALAFGGPMLSYAETPDDTGAPHAANGGYDTTSWLQGFGGTGRNDGNSNAAALGATFNGFLAGADARFGLLRAGLMGGYTRTNVSVNALASSGGIDSAQLGAYAGLSAGAFHLRGGGSASFDTIDANRSIVIPGLAESAHAHFNGYTGQVFGEVAYSLSVGQTALEPFAGLAYVRVHDAAFLESGGLAALSGSASDLNIGYSSLGLRAGTMVPLENGTVLVPHAAAIWQHAFGDVTPTAALAFQSTSAAFSVSGVPIAADTAVIEAGLDWRMSAQMKFGVGYQGELAKAAHTNMAKGNFTWNF
jgi:outer membrane autotransporter protein